MTAKLTSADGKSFGTVSLVGFADYPLLLVVEEMYRGLSDRPASITQAYFVRKEGTDEYLKVSPIYVTRDGK